jgi:hypothetical protein
MGVPNFVAGLRFMRIHCPVSSASPAATVRRNERCCVTGETHSHSAVFPSEHLHLCFQWSPCCFYCYPVSVVAVVTNVPFLSDLMWIKLHTIFLLFVPKMQTFLLETWSCVYDNGHDGVLENKDMKLLFPQKLSRFLSSKETISFWIRIDA